MPKGRQEAQDPVPSLQEWMTLQQAIAAKPDEYGYLRPHMVARAPSRPGAPTADYQVAIAQAETIVAHPGWQFFLNALEAEVQNKKAALAHWQDALLEAENATARLNVNQLKGELTGLKFAATLVPQLVSLGEAVRAATADSLESTAPTDPRDAAVTGAGETNG